MVRSAASTVSAGRGRLMISDDEEIERSRIEDRQKRPSKIKRAASEQLRRRKIIGEKLLKAKELNDARAYAEALRHGGVDDSSPEWKRAWDYFYDR
jgi:hypothetical protein